MGGIFSSNRNSNNAAINRLVENIEHLDQDGDGLVTKKELDNWRSQQEQALQEFKQQIIEMKEQEYGQKLIDANRKVEELESVVEDLKKINGSLEQRLRQKVKSCYHQGSGGSESATLREGLAVFSPESRERVNEMVERLIANENINVRGFPDYIERHLYRNVFQILLGLLNELVDTSSIEFMGHHITMKMSTLPVVDDPDLHDVSVDTNGVSEL